jgi:hypothetical protein
VIQLFSGFLPELRAAYHRSGHYPARAAVSIFLLVSLLAACSVPEQVVSVPSADITQAYETVEARLTLATLSTATATETPQTSPPTTMVNPQLNTGDQEPVQTPYPTGTEICDKAAPGFPMIDVNIEDGTEMQPGQRFSKIWRLTNAGACTWTRDYQAIWFFGTRLGDTTAVPLTRNVAPGESTEIEVEMVAPQNPGTYRSDWKLQNTAGEAFGIGPTGNSTFWVQIQVVRPPTETPAPIIIPTEAPEAPDPPPPPEITETVMPLPVVRLTATFNLIPGSTIDLSSGAENPESGGDLAFQPDENNNHWLTPANGLLLGVYGASEPALENCQSATKSSAAIAVGSISGNTFLCYQTEAGLHGWLKLVGFNADDSTIEIEILTWEIPE